ncbi:hypothetical protein AB0B92_13660 [Streptomyces hygroscopicus]|uniref:hypothetical protein n=1 Tax=Streptomyces hygroscopicus TaxID=1912 RepID=UPI0033DE3A05
MIETPDGFTLTVRGLQKAAQRALALRAEGDEEAACIWSLDPGDPRRIEFALGLALDAFSREMHQSGI